MTGPIKPPGGPGASIPSAPDAEGVAKGEAGAFGKALGAEATQGTDAAAPSIEASGVSADVAANLRAGEITPAEAVDRLVSEALKSPMASALNDAGRQALEAHLRESLADDPSLAALVSDLDRGQ